MAANTTVGLKLYIVFLTNSKKHGDCEVVDSFDSRLKAANFATKLRRKYIKILCKSSFKKAYPRAYKLKYPDFT